MFFGLFEGPLKARRIWLMHDGAGRKRPEFVKTIPATAPTLRSQVAARA